MNIAAFSKFFEAVEDPRQDAKIQFSMFDVIFLTMAAVIAGAEGWEDIEDFGCAHLNWLQEKGLFPEKIPAHDTIARIICLIDPAQFRSCFIHWAQSVAARTSGEVIAIDGKTLRGSYNREDRKSTIHMVSAFSTANGVVMGQIKTEQKSNEITAIPALLKLLDIKGCLVSIDAMGCQTKIAADIVGQGGDYLLAVKMNQDHLFKAVKKALSHRIKEADLEHAASEKGHGRYELRDYHVLPAGDLATQFPEWVGLKSIGIAIGLRLDKGKQDASLAFRFYISSAELDEAQFAKAVRGHWGIESMHWVLDVTMKEDDCPIYRGDAPEILATMRHISLNMLKAEKTKKASIRRKRKIASMDINYLDTVLFAGIHACVE